MPEKFERRGSVKRFKTNIAQFDEMLGGGMETGTIALLGGPAGVGKTTLGMEIISTIALLGGRTALYTFDERTDTVIHRCESLGICRNFRTISCANEAAAFSLPPRSPRKLPFTARRQRQSRARRSAISRGPGRRNSAAFARVMGTYALPSEVP